ncbi:MAG: hypothetical protein OES46_21410 [Gammaproteobacteria bacterium]|nr:hypothetical protein [Gammaproteobacteria bacterium]
MISILRWLDGASPLTRLCEAAFMVRVKIRLMEPVGADVVQTYMKVVGIKASIMYLSFILRLVRR